MPLKEGSLPTDKEVDISASSKTDRTTCNSLLCKLGYSREDDIRYPKVLQQVFGRLRTEENGDGNAAQQRHLYKKLSHCKDNYPNVIDLPNKTMCDKWYNKGTSTSPSYTPPPPQSNYRPPPPKASEKPTPPPPKASEKPTPSPQDVLLARADLVLLRSFIDIRSTFQSEVDELYKKLYALDRLATDVNDLIWKTNDMTLKKKMNSIRVDLIGTTGHASKVKLMYKDVIIPFNQGVITYENFFKLWESKQRKNAPKPPKPPKAPKTPKPPKTAKAPKTTKASKGPKTAKAPTPPPRTPTPPPRTPTPPRANSTRKRCPNGTRRNKKTGNCDPK